MLPITDELMRRRPAGVRRSCATPGLRAHVDERSETLNYKIREAETQKVPYMAVIGEREAEAGTVAVRRGERAKSRRLPSELPALEACQ